MKAYRVALEDLDKKEDEVYQHLADKVLDEEGYRRQIENIRSRRFEFTELLEKASHKITDATLENVQSTIELAKNAKTLWKQQSAVERRGLLEDILSNQVLDGPIVRYDLEKPFAVLAEMAQKEDWRSLRESNPCLRRERAMS